MFLIHILEPFQAIQNIINILDIGILFCFTEIKILLILVVIDFVSDVVAFVVGSLGGAWLLG